MDYSYLECLPPDIFFFLLIMCEFINKHKIRQQYAKKNIQVAASTMLQVYYLMLLAHVTFNEDLELHSIYNCNKP